MELFGYTVIRIWELRDLRAELADTRRAMAEQVNINGRLANQVNRLRLLLKNEDSNAQGGDDQRQQS